jgi:hypothetical protein
MRAAGDRIMRLIKSLDFCALEPRVTTESEDKELSTHQEESVHLTPQGDIDLQQLLEAAWVIQQHRTDLGQEQAARILMLLGPTGRSTARRLRWQRRSHNSERFAVHCPAGGSDTSTSADRP